MRTLKATVSSESMALPLGQPAMVFPLSSVNAETFSGSNGAATMRSLPRGFNPSIVLAIASLFGAVARTRSAPPSFCSASAAGTFCVSMYSCAPSCRTRSALSAPREMAMVRKPIRAANWMAR